MIEINNLTTFAIDEEFLKGIAKKVLEGENLSKKLGWEEGKLSIALLGPGRIRELNKKYRKKNRVTDVLAFSQNQKLKIKNQKFPIFPKDEVGLGEVVICLREVKKNAKRFGLTFEKELARILIHGILHLLGYDHEKGETAAKKMAEKEDYYLKLIFK